ncbi:MAG: molybdopterin-synthase adenylyltransferase MoeB [Candidatus Abyssobacteria bacterium SURF_17]|uniref:Molybdopterin-synthase adenylyltransferase n=1 Tax=Candidatus Abyssobacteria bacterium SURF_17 TaxID=2093361 RepID=A0A419F945_9BACT|nr:MAG: molybdopterin-synthase adenylyltransferase MoeB [Candidatus Abyssubacteria bacterium SURF_17]
MEFTQEQIKRYSRHIILKEVGGKGQKKMLDARVLVIGAGGLGSPSAFYLAAAGIGTLGILDFDTVDLSNLQRQILHKTSDLDRPKVESAKETITALNPDVRVVVHNERLTSKNAFQIFGNYDVIVDGCDNFATRYLTNDACVMLGKPNVHGSVLLFEGHVSVFDAKRGPCYRCQYPVPPPPGMVPSCQEAGVLGVVPGIIGTLQAVETLKLILGIGNPLIGRLLHVDGLTMSIREFKLHKDPKCPVCGEDPTVTELIDYEEFCSLRGGDE